MATCHFVQYCFLQEKFLLFQLYVLFVVGLLSMKLMIKLRVLDGNSLDDDKCIVSSPLANGLVFI